MAVFLYFVPTERTPGGAKARLGEAGLRHVLEKPEPTVGVWDRGPGDQSGSVVQPAAGVGGTQGPRQYAPDRQAWEQISDTGIWIGVETATPPTPEDLLRATIRPGHKVRLADGRDWTVPTARLLNGTTPFPQTIRVTPAGEKQLQVIRPMQALWQLACNFWDEWMRTGDDEVNGKEFKWVGRDEAGTLVLKVESCFDTAVEVLAHNYRLGPAEASLAELLTSENVTDILLALVDWPSVEALKKTEAAGCSIGPGRAAS